MKCLYPISIQDSKDKSRFVQVPCGHCIPCRINKSLEWLIRLEYENQCHPYSSFVTLTYNDENLPKDNGLHKADLQKFMKLLRFNSSEKYKYYGIGEYGETELKYFSPESLEAHGRPHYHLIIFGLKPDCDESRELVFQSWKKCNREMIIDPIHKAVGTVTHDSMLYVCDYMQKKQYSVNGLKLYGNAQPPFQLCSQRLGLDGFLNDNVHGILSNGFITYNSLKAPIPRYFRKKLDYQVPFTISDDDVYKKFCLDKGLVKYNEVDYLDQQSNKIRHNMYQYIISDEFPEHLAEVEKLLKAKNNLRGDKL